jgi:eukaryotic-like serine/threonine-protein kinase
VNAAPDWERVRLLFHGALEVAPEARLTFVKERADDDGVFKEVMSLLETYPAADGFLSDPVMAAGVAAARAHLRRGDRVGCFEVVDLIGSGGMGEVYRARDTRLDRDVAIKVLSSGFDEDPAGRERLAREARAIAKLTHPRISTLHDVGSAHIGGVDTTYLVMEFVEGETLAARLRRGPLPLDSALPVAIDVAEALVAAHAAGVVHRDLKPANVMLTRSGAKLLDFGLARLHPQVPFADRATGIPAPESSSDSAMAGTPPYMAPEQFTGGACDARGDLFAFGAMLYEMVTGHRAFEGRSHEELVQTIVEREPAPMSTHVPDLPPALERLVSTCLAKDPEERWQTARDLLRELRWLYEDRSNRSAPAAPARAVSPRAVAAAVGFSLLLLAAVSLAPRRTPIARRTSFSVYAPDGTKFPRGTADMAVSPDGSRLVFAALFADGSRKLWIRRFDSVDTRAIDGSEGGTLPFWSPDGRSIAFFARGKLKRITEAGGVAQDICDLRLGARGGTWNREGTILFAAFGQPLMRVADTGGTPSPATIIDPARGEFGHSWPVFLPDGRHFAYLAFSSQNGQTAIYEGSLDAKAARRLFAAESRIGVAGTQLLSLSKGVLVARAYDADHRQLDGAVTPIAEHIANDTPQRSGGAFAVAGDVIAYRSASPDSRLIWFDRGGKHLSEFPTRADYHHPWLSPDETQLAVEKTDAATGRHTIWILDLRRGTTARLLLDPAGAHGPVWSPDGQRVSFASNRLGGVDLFEIRADGSAPESFVVSSKEGGLEVTDWSLDGRLLLYQTSRGGNYDLLTVSPSPNQDPQPVLQTPAREIHGQFSPDSRWIAYTSDESGTPEVYIRRFPIAGGKSQISTRGGAQPRWRRDGKELFYLALDGTLMAVSVAVRAEGIETSAPRELFKTGITGSFLERRNHYVVTRDGQRFLVNVSAEDENSAPITVVMNWEAATQSLR